MKKTLVIMAILIVFMLGRSLEYKQFLALEDAENREVTLLPLESGGFTLKFQHSVHLTPVYEFYQTDDENNMILLETRFSSLGVGMPFTSEEGVFTINNGEFSISGLNRKINKIPLRVSPIPEHAVIIDNQVYSILSFGQPGGLINITTRKKWVFSER